MVADIDELHKKYDDLELRDKNRLLRSGSDLISAIYELDKDLANAVELSEYCADNSDADDLGNTFRSLERLYNADYERISGSPITWDLDKLREEDTLEELDRMLSPGLKEF